MSTLFEQVAEPLVANSTRRTLSGNIDQRFVSKFTERKLSTIAFLVDMYVTREMSIPEIAMKVGWPKSRVRDRLLKLKVTLRSCLEASEMAKRKGKFINRAHSHKPLSVETREKISKARLAWGDKHAKGTRITPNGYVEFTRGPHKGRLEHDVVMETIIGRRLLPGETVHHKKRNEKTNNDVSNLELMTRSRHAYLHGKENHSKRQRRTNGTFA